MNSNREKITNIVMVGVFAAVLAVLSQISFPLPSGIPVTLQTFAVALCGYALGCKRGTLAVLVYIVLGAVGLPVFANFSGGFGSLVGLAGGYIDPSWVKYSSSITPSSQSSRKYLTASL